MCALDKISQNLLFMKKNIVKFVEDKFLFLIHSLEGGLVKIVKGANNTVHFAKKKYCYFHGTGLYDHFSICCK